MNRFLDLRLAARGGAAVLSALILLAGAPAPGEDEPLVVGEGRRVGIEYTLTLEDGSTAGTNVGGAPLVYNHGGGEILDALQAALVGLSIDDTKHVTLTAEQGYGAVLPEAFLTVSASDIPEEARRPGAQLVAQDDSGNQRQVRVHEVHEDEIVLDMNHPLAGKALIFDIKILSIEDAEPAPAPDSAAAPEAD